MMKKKIQYRKPQLKDLMEEYVEASGKPVCPVPGSSPYAPVCPGTGGGLDIPLCLPGGGGA